MPRLFGIVPVSVWVITETLDQRTGFHLRIAVEALAQEGHLALDPLALGCLSPASPELPIGLVIED